jgi:hypothetical protein
MQRLAELKSLLGPLTSENDEIGDDHKYDDYGCVLLCWGSPSSCHVLAVNHIGRNIDQELFWKKLQMAWNDTRGRWRQKMPWYRIRSVEQVKIRLVGPIARAKDLFHGVYNPANKAIEAEKRKLQETIRAFPEFSVPNSDDDFSEGDPCFYDYKHGSIYHNEQYCDLLTYGGTFGFQDEEIPDLTCSVEEYYKKKERLTRLKMEPLRTLLFQNPKMAVYNELWNAKLVHSSK